MNGWPEVTVLIVTYDRPREIRLTISGLLEHLHYPGTLRWHLADDGSPGNYLNDLQREFSHLTFSRSVTERKGWGKNVNTAMGAAPTDYIYLNEDDYVPKRRIDLGRGVALMETVETVGLVRYDGVSGHFLDLKLREARSTKVGRLDYLVVEPDSPHLNCYSHRPHLKHKRFHEFYGNYREAKVGEPHLGISEVDFANRYKDKKGGPLIAVLDDGIVVAFDHIGRSRQGSEFDRVE